MDECSFVFIVPSYNNSDWVERNIESICAQEHARWRAIYIDDASTDDTYDKAVRCVERLRMACRFVFLRNSANTGQAFSRHAGYNHPSCRDDEIAVLLDGDDWLLHPRVLGALEREYTRHDLDVTYGQFKVFQGGALDPVTRCTGSYPADTARVREHRAWKGAHLRTARVGLLRQIPADYLQHRGRWITCCTDVAEMMFVLERASGRHRNIGEPLVVYNKDNSVRYPNSYYNLARSGAAQRRLHRELLQKYAPGMLRRR